jgi:hypothetical protein
LLVLLGADVEAVAGTPMHVAASKSAVAVCDLDGGVRLIVIGPEGQLVVADGVLPGVRCVAVRHDDSGPVVVGGTIDGAVSELSPDGQGRLVAQALPGAGRWTAGAIAVTQLAWGALVAIGTGGRELHLLAATSGQITSLGAVSDVTRTGISSIAFVQASLGLPSGLLVGDGAGRVRFWEFDDDGNLTPRRTGRPHLHHVSALSAASTPTGPVGVSCEEDGKVATWPLEAAELDAGGQQEDIDLAAAGQWSVVMREGGAIECWTLTADDRLVLESSSPPRDGAVVNTVDRSGRARAFRADLTDDPTVSSGRRRMVRLHPYRALAVGPGESDEPIALALRDDGVLEVYDRRLARSPETAQTGTNIAVSVSLSTGPDNHAVVTWGDTEGAVRMRPWSQRADPWDDTPAWAVGSADIRTAWRGDTLLTGDGSGVVRLWSLVDGALMPRSSDGLTHGRPITAVALDGDEFAVSGDRNGTVLITPIERGRLGTAAAERIELGAAVLAMARVDRHKVIVWCRPGAVVLTWDDTAASKG